MACAARGDSDQPANPLNHISLGCPHEKKLGSYLPTECTVKTLIRLSIYIESSLGAPPFCWFCHEEAHDIFLHAEL